MANKFYKEKLFEPIIDRLKVKGSPVKPKVRPNVKPGKDPGLAWLNTLVINLVMNQTQQRTEKDLWKMLLF